MLPHETRQPLPHGKLAENALHFARLLRGAGLPVGTDRALLMLQALRVAGIGSRTELHDVLQACLINRAEHRALFDQAFRLFWSEPDRLGQTLRMLLPAAADGCWMLCRPLRPRCTARSSSQHSRPPRARAAGPSASSCASGTSSR